MNILDNLISFFDPEAGFRRQAARAAQERLLKVRQENKQRNSPWQYSGASVNRWNRSWIPTRNKADSINVGEAARLRDRAWDLYRNNPFAAKAVRAIISRIVGGGLHPESQAVSADGTAFTEFRNSAKSLFDVWGKEAYDLGKPGRGGMKFDELLRLILTEVILSGEVLVHFRHLDAETTERLGLTIPLTIQLINAQRLIETISYDAQSGNIIFRGVELDKDYRRVAYHVYEHDIWSPLTFITPNNFSQVRIPANEILHIYSPASCQEIRGVSWLAPVLQQLKDIGDFQYNELLASTIANCFAMVIERTGSLTPSLGGGLATGLGTNTSDDNGNPLTFIEPGMIHNLAPGEKVQSVNPDHPNTNAPEFISQMLRSVSVGMPGVKSSALTGDFRQSSFSSETANENDLFYEIQGLQDWFFSSCCEPIWEQMVNVALLAGELPSGGDPRSLRLSSWKGPVSRPINPMAYEQASAMAIQNGTSSVVIECAKKGLDYRKVLSDQQQASDHATALGLPEPYINNNILGLKQPMVPVDVEGDAADPEGSGKAK
jgi:lambda family phage portal protein